MKRYRFLALWVLSALIVGLLRFGAPDRAAAQGELPGVILKPYRVLVITGIQMRDAYVIHSAGDFGDGIALLKLWGIPFDILRLDSHTLALTDFVDGLGQARYGAILWTAQQDQYPWQTQDYGVLAQAVNDHHISLIALADKIQEPVIQGLIGLAYDGWGSISDNVVVGEAPHFISRDRIGTVVPASEAFTDGNGPRVTVKAPDVEVLATAGSWPQLAARTVDANTRTRAVWLGGDAGHVFSTSPAFIELIQRSLVWAMGYGLYKDYGYSVVHRMDDPGGAQTAYLGSWHYPQLSQTTIQDSIIAPLQAHAANLGVGFNPGYLSIPTHSIVRSSEVDFVDPYGARQNIVSTTAGLLDGIAADVIEVQSHGLTHMVPDLDNAIPGSTNWWDGGVGGEWDRVGWYREFYDTRRGMEVNATTQTARLSQSADWIEQDFGLRPLIFVPGGHAISGDRYEGGSGVTGAIDLGGVSGSSAYSGTHIAANYTYKLAGEAGYGLALDTMSHYLGNDYVVTLPVCLASYAGDTIGLQEILDRGVPAVVYFHDRDIANNPDYLASWLNIVDATWPDLYYLSMNEWVGYLHAKLDATAPTAASVRLSFTYDRHYGRYFDDHSSLWTLHLSDELLADFQALGRTEIVVDDRVVDTVAAAAYFTEFQDLDIPSGVGTHTIRLEGAPHRSYLPRVLHVP
jgi:hypothetical protein